jgi:filamentous hemagglutinin family protein
MYEALKSFLFKTFPLATLGAIAAITSARAQITPDDSLGAESSTVAPENINGIPSDLINGGAARGENLFHSFKDFNIGEGRGAYFANPDGIANILSRVTGGNASTILGKLGVLGNANLFLINPAGILFGQNASLDVKGSFVGTTADSVVFGDGFEFRASDPSAPPLLTINIPNGLRFRDNPKPIQVKGVGQDVGLDGIADSFNNPTLEVLPGQNLFLIGGDVILDGGVLQAPGGLVELGGLSAAGTVSLNEDGSLSFPENVARGNVSIDNQAGINVITDDRGGGSININAQNIDIFDASLLTAGIIPDLGEIDTQTGDVNLNAIDTTTIDGSRIDNNVTKGTIADNKNISIATGSLLLANGAILSASNLDDSETKISGDVKIETKGKITIDKNARIFSNGFFGRVFLTSLNDSIDIKDSRIFTESRNDVIDPDRFSKIELTAPQGSISLNNASITAENSGRGYSGDIALDARDEISIKDSSISALGNQGRISIGNLVAPSQVKLEGIRSEDDSGFSFSNQLTANSSNPDDLAGKITINARDRIEMIGSLLESRTQTTRKSIDSERQDQNNFSTIKLKVLEGNPTGKITLDRSQISTTNSDIGFAGDVILNASDKIEILNSAIFSRGKEGRILIGKSQTSGETSLPQYVSFDNSSLEVSNDSVIDPETKDEQINAGNISIDAVNNISFVNNSQISTSTERQGNAGNLTVQSENGVVSLDNSQVFSNVNIGGIGKAGNINITANSINLTNGSSLQSGVVDDDSQGGKGNGGSITLNAQKDVTITGRNQNGEFSGIFTDVEPNARGNAGNIYIDAKSSIFLNSLVSDNSNTVELRSRNDSDGLAGNITLTAGERISIVDSEISSTSNYSSDENFGTIALTVNPENPNGSIIVDNSQINTTNSGFRFAGDIILNATNKLEIKNNSEVSSDGNRGRILIGKSAISGETSSPRQVSLDNSSLTTTNESVTEAETEDINAGEISIDAIDSIFLVNRSEINSSTKRKGNAGNVTLNANNGDISFADVSSIFNTVDPGTDNEDNPTITQGNGGTINISAKNLTMTDGAQLQTAVKGQQGDAGNIIIKTSGNVSLSGFTSVDLSGKEGFFPTSIFSNSNNDGQGNGGDIDIQANSLALDRSRIDTSNIPAKPIESSNNELTKGGNITLNINDLLLMRNDSKISAEAGESANGGNVNIKSGFLVAFPSSPNGSDIIAKAVRGNGGRIDITTKRIFGLKERKAIPENRTNDIDVSSEFGRQGEILIETSDIDPSRGLIDLTQTVTDPEEQIAQNPCTKGKDSEFFITGRGGIVPKPYDIINPDGVEVGLVDPVSESGGDEEQRGMGAEEQRSGGDEEKTDTASAPPELPPPAQGWIFTDDGRVILTSYDPTGVGGVRSRQNPNTCPAP